MNAVPQFQLSDRFEEAEYRRRTAKFQARLEERGLDGILLFAIESHNYLYGYDQIGAWFFQTLIVPTGKDPVAFVRHADQWLAGQSPFISEIHTYRDTDPDPIGRVAELLQDHGLAGRRIGIEMASQFLNATNYERLKQHLTKIGCAIEDASDIVGDLRLIKSPAEVANLRAAGRILDATYTAAFDTVRPGVRECDVYAESLRAMYRAGGSQSGAPIAIGSGINTLTFSHYGPTRRVIGAGEPVFIEAGGCFNHYHAVGVQTVCAGQPDDEMKRLFDESRRTVNAARPILGPGVPAADVARAMAATLDASAQESWGIHFGYGIGIGSAMFWFDNLRLSQTSRYILEPGMSFFIFSGRMKQDGYFLLVGEPILITDTGFEDLSSHERDVLRALG